MTLWRIHRRLKARVEQAQQEARESERVAEETRERIVKPLTRKETQNHYAELIRASLGLGYGRGRTGA